MCLISFTSSVFHVFIHAYFTCIWVVIFLDLELQKWPDFFISRCGRGSVFFDRDRVIVDRELQGPQYIEISSLVLLDCIRRLIKFNILQKQSEGSNILSWVIVM